MIIVSEEGQVPRSKLWVEPSFRACKPESEKILKASPGMADK